MDKLNLDLYKVLLTALVVRSVVDGGNFPLAIGISALIGILAFQSHLAKEKNNTRMLDEAKIKAFEDRVGSIESKYALTVSSSRRM